MFSTILNREILESSIYLQELFFPDINDLLCLRNKVSIEVRPTAFDSCHVNSLVLMIVRKDDK